MLSSSSFVRALYSMYLEMNKVFGLRMKIARMEVVVELSNSFNLVPFSGHADTMSAQQCSTSIEVPPG
jgi:hypothetical protein